MTKTTRVASVQFNYKPGDKAYNLKIIAEMRRKAGNGRCDNGMHLIFSNGIGRDDEVRTGIAMRITCFGEVIRESKAIEDDMVIGDFNADLLASAIDRNWIRGRRPVLYNKITRPREDILIQKESE